MPHSVSCCPQFLVNALIWLQAPSLAWINPGRCFASQHGCKLRWTVTGLGAAAIVDALASVQKEDARRWYRVFPKAGAGKFESWYLTPFGNWLDKQNLAVTKEEGGRVHIDARSVSTCVWPAYFPFALILGLVFIWCPFQDMDKNREHLDELCDAVTAAGGVVTVEDV